MRPDRLIVGEVRGPEVLDLLVALNTGHEGGLSTVHANDTAAVPARLEALAALAGLSRDAVHSHIAAALHAVVHLVRDADGRRRVDAVGVFQRAPDGLVRVLPALVAPPSTGGQPASTAGQARRSGPAAGPGLPLLRHLLRTRGVDLPTSRPGSTAAGSTAATTAGSSASTAAGPGADDRRAATVAAGRRR